MFLLSHDTSVHSEKLGKTRKALEKTRKALEKTRSKNKRQMDWIEFSFEWKSSLTRKKLVYFNIV